MSWANKLSKKLTALADTSSKETLQTLAKWIGFNRKHAAAFASTLSTAVSLANGPRQVVLIDMLGEVLVLEAGTPSWDRLEALRTSIGEDVLLPTAGDLQPEAQQHLLTKLDEWDAENVFGGPTLIKQLRDKLQGHKEEATSAPNETAAPAGQPKDDGKEEPMASPIPPKGTTTVVEPRPEASYDFDASGIPAVAHEPKDFTEDCRSIATLQIARDLRNDSAVQTSSLLSALPEDVRRLVAESAEQEGELSIPEEQARDFSIRINETVLDMDMDEQLLNVDTFRKILERQRVARRKLIRLLIESRCRFGAHEAAEAFTEADRAKAELAKRKQILVDAMELEGLDVEMSPDKRKDPVEEELPPLSWYKKEASPAAKRQRTE